MPDPENPPPADSQGQPGQHHTDVTAPASAGTAEVGQQVVEQIKAYDRSRGQM